MDIVTPETMLLRTVNARSPVSVPQPSSLLTGVQGNCFEELPASVDRPADGESSVHAETIDPSVAAATRRERVSQRMRIGFPRRRR